jgi:CRP/FNR family cyclic AMP-dependent transcriptional regulator
MDRNHEWSNKILVEDCFRLLEPSPPRLVELKPKETFFSRGDRAESIFYLNKGFGKLTVSSKNKKQATIAFLVAGDFIGEEALTSEVGIRTTTATALTRCTALEIGRKAMIRIIQQEHACADLLLKSLLAKNSQFQEALVEKRFNSGSRRLARTLLLMAETGRPGGESASIPVISQAALAATIGVTRSQVHFLLKHLSDLGLVENQGEIKIKRSRIRMFLQN